MGSKKTRSPRVIYIKYAFARITNKSTPLRFCPSERLGSILTVVRIACLTEYPAEIRFEKLFATNNNVYRSEFSFNFYFFLKRAPPIASLITNQRVYYYDHKTNYNSSYNTTIMRSKTIITRKTDDYVLRARRLRVMIILCFHKRGTDV